MNQQLSKVIKISLIGTMITLVFAIFNGVYGLIFASIWYGVFAGYYCLLGLQKILLLGIYQGISRRYCTNEKQLTREKQKIYLANGVIFVPLTIALTIIISIILSKDNPTHADDIMAITIATYTTYKITMAIINLVKAKRQDDALLQTWRNINLVEALTAIILLESTLITTFGELNGGMRLIVILSGLAVCVFNICLGGYMVIRGIKKLKH